MMPSQDFHTAYYFLSPPSFPCGDICSNVGGTGQSVSNTTLILMRLEPVSGIYVAATKTLTISTAHPKTASITMAATDSMTKTAV
jgi:hypothetical protein